MFRGKDSSTYFLKVLNKCYKARLAEDSQNETKRFEERASKTHHTGGITLKFSAKGKLL